MKQAKVYSLYLFIFNTILLMRKQREVMANDKEDLLLKENLHVRSNRKKKKENNVKIILSSSLLLER